MKKAWQPLVLYATYWRRFPGLFAGSFLIGPVMAVQNVVTPLFVAIGLGQLVKHHHVQPRIIIYAAASLLVSLTLGYFINLYCDATLEHKVEQALYEDCFAYLVHQDYNFFADNFSGSLVAQANRLIKAYSNYHLSFFMDILPQLTGVIFVLAVMMFYSVALGGVIAVLWLVSIALIIWLAVRRMPHRRTAVAKESVQTGELADVVGNAIAVKTFAAEDREIARYRATNRERGHYFFRSWSLAIRNGWVVELACAALQMTVFVGGIIAVEHKTISLAVFLLFQVYILQIVNNLRRASWIVRQIEVTLGDAQEMTELLTLKPLVQDRAKPERSAIKQGSIAFTNVAFSYGEQANDDALFNDLTLSIKPGEKIGLVGPSGGGKTTITKLLLRFVDIQGGSITIDGQDIRAIRQQDLRRAIAYVPQEPSLFHRSVRENIAYGKPDATDDEIIAVAKKAFAHDFIASLPQGYDTLVGERGVKLSGGQRQRIAIARAMLKNAPILVLDEATAALDSESEIFIQKALWKLMAGRTAIVIAHRLSTIQRMDRIVVLKDGAIAEQGTHADLLAAKGLYATLWNHQSGGFIEE